MTASRLQSIALMLSRAALVRHWLHWNYPQQEPWLMAIDVREMDGKPYDLKGELERSGFTRTVEGVMDATGECVIYTIPRTNEDETPYRSGLY